MHINFAFLPKRKYMRLFSVFLQFLSSFFFLNYQWQQLIIKTKATDVFFIRIRSKVHTLGETKKIHLDCKRVVYRLDKQLWSVDIPISGNMVRFCGRIQQNNSINFNNCFVWSLSKNNVQPQTLNSGLRRKVFEKCPVW